MRPDAELRNTTADVTISNCWNPKRENKFLLIMTARDFIPVRVESVCTYGTEMALYRIGNKKYRTAVVPL